MKPRISKEGQKILNDPALSASLMEAINALGEELISGQPIYFGEGNQYKVTISSAATITNTGHFKK
ncbi:MAG TPA: hypothetical protein VLB84_04785 [Bacteroidia bacterium]|nr:hypothetical protein [Bacteroidia bacterium]